MTEAEKKSIILKYVSDNPDIDHTLLPRIAIPFYGKSAKYGGQYTRYYLADTGMQYINEIPGSEVSETKPLFMAHRAKRTSYDKYIHYLYIKHIPELGMCEFKLMHLQGNGIDRKKLTDEREFLMHPEQGWECGYFKNRVFIFKDDPYVYQEDGSQLYERGQKKYYNNDFIKALNYVANIQSNEMTDLGITKPNPDGVVNYWTPDDAALPSVEQFRNFIKSCTNGSSPECEFNMAYMFGTIYKKFCYPRGSSTRTLTIDRSNPYASFDSLLKSVDEINEECKVTYRYKGKSSWGSYSVDCLPDIVCKSQLNRFGYVEKINDKLIIMRMFETRWNYQNDLCEKSKLPIEVATTVKNDVQERNRYYFNLETGKMSNFTYNSYRKEHSLANYNDTIWTDYAFHEDILINSGFYNDMCKDFVKRINSESDYAAKASGYGYNSMVRDKITIIYRALKYPIYSIMYDNGMQDFAYDLIRCRNDVPELFCMANTKSKDAQKNFGMSLGVLKIYENMFRKRVSTLKPSEKMPLKTIIDTMRELNFMFDESEISTPTIQEKVDYFINNVTFNINSMYPYGEINPKHRESLKITILNCSEKTKSEQVRRIEAISNTYNIWRDEFKVDYPWYTADIDATEDFSIDLMIAYKANDTTLIPAFTVIP